MQARTGSQRLPGKVLADLGGRPVLGVLLDRLRGAVVDRLVVATTDGRADDPVVALAEAHGADVVRGPEDDVLARFRQVIDRYRPSTIVRITADCPFVDRGLLAECVARQRESGADYASNTVIRTFPDGLDVEVVAAAALLEADEESTDPFEREHVTPFIYRRPERYRLAAVVGQRALGHLRWTLDTTDDLDALRALAAATDDPSTAAWEDVLRADPQGATVPPGPWWRPALPGEETLVGGVVDDPGVRHLILVGAATPPAVATISVTSGRGRVELLWPSGVEDPAARDALARGLAGEAQLREVELG